MLKQDSEIRIWHTILPVLCLGQLILVGLAVFSSGFLLNRQVIELNSTCTDFPESSFYQSEGQSTDCWMPKSYKKAIILIIDALRYDFAAYNSSVKEADAPPFLNKMPIFQEILDKHPSQALLAPLVADPPTTTMQRLKGITTGSLPTFIEASQNFAR